MTAGTANAQAPTSSPTATPVVIVEPDMWRVILVGKDCPLSVFEDMALIEAELFAVLQSHVPDLSYVAPGAPIARRNLEEANESEGDHQSRGLQTSTCPKRWQCKKAAWEGKSKHHKWRPLSHTEYSHSRVPLNYPSDWCNLLGCAGCTSCRRRALQSLGSDTTSNTVPTKRSLRSGNGAPERRLAAWYNAADGTWSWTEAPLNSWVNYTAEEQEFNALVASMPQPPANYLSAIHDMDEILVSMAVEMNANLTSTESPCFLGARLVSL